MGARKPFDSPWGIRTSRVKLGADASAAAGPAGRDASARDGCNHKGGDTDVFACARPFSGSLTHRSGRKRHRLIAGPPFFVLDSYG
jgi:hypothetical protein